MRVLSLIRGLWIGGRGVLAGFPADIESLDPFDLFGQWYTAARKSGLILPEAMTLATATTNGRPSARMVLLKEFDQQGFVFYTNLASRKSRELQDNPYAALVMYWGLLQRQVRVEGKVVRLPRERDATYFDTRPRGSQIGAWASRQSEVLPRAEKLREKYREYESRFAGMDVPLPEFWGGFRLVPDHIEFWQGRANRLHDRLVFSRTNGQWSAKRLYP